MDGVDEETAGQLQSALDEHGFLSWLDVRVLAVDEGELTLKIPYDEGLCNHGPSNRGEVNGGVAATLIDTAGGLACRTALEAPFAGGVATIDLNVSYLRSALGDLTATASVVRAGQSVGVSEVTVESETRSEGHAEVAVGRGSYRLFRTDTK